MASDLNTDKNTGRALYFSSDQREVFTKNGMDLRMSVLQSSLLIESLIKDTLNHHKIKARSDTNDRIQQLIEQDILLREEKEAFTWFLHIRNQFIHNIEARTMRRCLELTNGVNAKRLHKRFHAPPTGDEETDLMNSFVLLEMELSRIMNLLIKRSLMKYLKRHMDSPLGYDPDLLG